MHPLPEPLPSSATPRQPLAYLAWILRNQSASILIGTLLDSVWLCTLAFGPWVIGRAVDEGVTTHDIVRLLLWTGLLLVIEVVHSLVEGLRDRGGVINWTRATYRSVGLISRHSVRAGFSLSKRISTGEVSTTVTGDAMAIAYLTFMAGALLAAVFSYIIVGVIVLNASVPLGILVLVGVPISSALFFFVVRPLRVRQKEQRIAMGHMTSLAADTVTGLRVLKGIGGEEMFLRRYRNASAETRASGIRLATPLGVIDGIQILLPGCFIVALTWIGANLVVGGELTPGQLVSFYGYAGFLVIPIQVAADTVSQFTRSQIGAVRVLSVLAVEPLTSNSAAPSLVDSNSNDLTDDVSGLHLRAGILSAVVDDDASAMSALLDRLARLDDSASGAHGVRLGSTPLTSISLEDVRQIVVRVDAEPYLFDGTLGEAVDPYSRLSDERVRAAVRAASAEDIVDSSPHGLETRIGERGRRMSGGERQRIGLARALAIEPEWLLLETPTSAVDANTEAIIANRLRKARSARGTLLATTSPPLLAEAQEVHILQNGRVIASGTHSDLLQRSAEYRAIVRRAGEQA